MGVAGFVCFASDAPRLIREEIILKMFDNSETPVLIASILMILTSLNTFFFSFKPTKDILMSMFFTPCPEGQEESDQEKFRNNVVTFGLMIASIACGTLIIVFEVSFVAIIDLIADIFMPCLFIFIPLLFYLKNHKKPSVFAAVSIAAGFYLLNLGVQFKVLN